MKPVPSILRVLPALAFFAGSPGFAADDPAPLPIQRVVLYKHGLGYFERQGEIQGDARVQLRFKQAEMSDVLKSLTALDRSGGQVTTVAYDSQKPQSEILAEYAFSLETGDIQLSMLRQLRGARIQATIAGGDKVTGSILGLDERQHAEGERVAKTMILSLFTDQGEMRAIPLFDLVSFEFTDPALAADLARYLETLRSSHRRDEKTVDLVCEGEGKRTVFASYAVEQSVWKATYRLVLMDEGKPPLLQGWAIVDNSSEDDWNDVELSLIAGLPISFRHDLYTPKRKERPLLQIQEQALMDVSGIVEMEKAKADGADFEDDRKDAKPKGRYGSRGLAVATKSGALPEPAAAPTMAFEDAISQQQDETVTREIGDLLEYRIDHKVTIPRNRSALLPIVAAPVEGTRVSLYRENARSTNPLSAVRFVNTSGVVLEGGPMTLLDGATYAGEAYLDSVKMGELRYVPFAVDLGVKAESKLDSKTDRVRRITIKNGMMTSRYDLVETKSYRFENKNPEPRRIVIEHPRRNGYQLRAPAKPFEQDLNIYRFEIPALGAQEKATIEVVETYEMASGIEVRSVDDSTLLAFDQSGLLNDQAKKFLRDVLEKKAALSKLSAELELKKTEAKTIASDQDRIRNNLRSLRSSAEEKDLRKSYIDQMKQQEADLKRLASEIQKLEGDVRGATSELDRTLISVELDYGV